MRFCITAKRAKWDGELDADSHAHAAYQALRFLALERGLRGLHTLKVRRPGSAYVETWSVQLNKR